MIRGIVELIHKVFNKLNKFRSFYYKNLFCECGNNLEIYGKIFIKNPHNLRVGRNVSMNDGVYINAYADIFIGDNVAISAGALIVSAGLEKTGLQSKNHYCKNIIIGNNVQIGAGAILLPGAIINDNSIVGAGSLVAKEMPGNSVLVGIPCRQMSEI